MRAFVISGAVVALFAGVTAAEARTSAEQAQIIAKRRGYTVAQSSCFSNLFQRYASQNSNGRWVVQHGRQRRGASHAFKAELAGQCGINT